MSDKASKIRDSITDTIEVPLIKKPVSRLLFIVIFICAALCTIVFSVILMNNFNEVYLLNAALSVLNVVSAAVTIISGSFSLLAGCKSKGYLVLRLLIAVLLIIIVGTCMIIVVTGNLTKPHAPSETFPHAIKLNKTPEDIENEASVMFGDEPIAQLADDMPFNVPDLFEDNHTYLFPKADSNNIHSILENTHNIFDFIEQSGILNKSSDDFETFSTANSDTLNSSSSVIPELGETYGAIMKKVEKRYKNLNDNYYNSDSHQFSISAAIREFNEIIACQEAAKAWSSEHADGVSLDLVVLLARNYKEVADLLYNRGDLGDTNIAIENYTKAIIEYSLFYRMCEREGVTKKIEDYQVLYWIADIYHSLGDIQIEREAYSFRLVSFGTADSFFSRNAEYRKSGRFEAYSRYYSAMSNHKLYNAVDRSYNGTLPIELKYYLHDAYINYRFVKDSNKLTYEEQKDAKRAMGQIADACVKYLKQHPEEEKGDIMKSRSYYARK